MALAAPTAAVTHAELDDARNGTWAQQAACRGVDPTRAEWFPRPGHAHSPATVEAKRICLEECPVQSQCLLWALTTNAHRDRGTWGGHTHRELVALRVVMQANGDLPILRICANPACRKEFSVRSHNVMRHGVCCSNACRLRMRRLKARTARLNRS